MNGSIHLSFARGAFAVLLTLAHGCGDTMEADADMNRELDRVFEHAELVDRELDSHAFAVTSAGEVSTTESAEVSHRDVLGRHVDDLDRVLGDMSTYCRHRSTQELGRTHEMQSAMAALRTELERHRLASRPDLPTARSEEEKHIREARGLLRTVRDAGARMRHEAGFYRCQHGNH